MMNTENKKNYVLIVGASDLVMPAYCIARNDLNLGIVALDMNIDAPGMKYADYALQVSTKDIEQAVIEAKNIAKKLNIIGVFTCGADVEVTVAAIAEALSLPGIPLDVAKRCNDKILMHKYFDKFGFKDRAKYQIINTLEEAKKAGEIIGYPCFIKPIDNCASRGVQRIESMDDMEAAYQLAVSFSGVENAPLLIEESLDGSKHTVEMIACQGERHLLSLIDTHYISERWPCETGLNTTEKDAKTQRKMFDFSSKVSDLIGIKFGAHKVDINIDNDGNIKVIELTARLSGGFHCQYASPIAFGSNDIRAALRLAIGEPLNHNDITHQYEKGAAVLAVFPEPGVVTGISGEDDAQSLVGVEEVFIWASVGDSIGPYQNSADRPAFVIAGGETAQEAVENAKNGASKIKIETRVA